MASPSFALSLLLIFIAMPYPSLSCSTILCECELNLRLYMHQIVEPDPRSNQVVTIRSNATGGFGTTVVVDYTIADAPPPNATIVARAKGMKALGMAPGVPDVVIFSYFSIVFQQNSRFPNSTHGVMEMLSDAGELMIMGGTGQFASAHGIITFKNILNIPRVENYRELNISAFYTPRNGYTCLTAIE